MRVHLARLEVGPPWVDLPVEEFERLAALDRFGQHQITDDPARADLVLFSQCHMLPTDWRLRVIRQHGLTQRYREKVMIYEERDRPWCSFPGVYVSMPKRFFDERYQKAWGYFRIPQVASCEIPDPDLLFSFVGSATSRCRRPLFALRHRDAVVEEVRRFTFYDPTSPDFEEKRTRFEDVLGRSRFVLCPRGRGTSSFRLYEALATGRVPVIISDDWVAPQDPDWESFSIRWPEGRVRDLIEMLEDRDRNWPAMSLAASAAWREFFAPEVSFHRVVEACRDVQKMAGTRPFPRSGVHGRAFIAAGADVARWRTTSTARHTAKRCLRRLGIAA